MPWTIIPTSLNTPMLNEAPICLVLGFQKNLQNLEVVFNI